MAANEIPQLLLSRSVDGTRGHNVSGPRRHSLRRSPIGIIVGLSLQFSLDLKEEYDGRGGEAAGGGVFTVCSAFLSLPSTRKNNRNCSGLAPARVLLGIVSNWVEPITYVARKLALL